MVVNTYLLVKDLEMLTQSCHDNNCSVVFVCWA